MARTIRVGTRGSSLATTQTDLILKKLRQFRPDAKFEIVIIKTSGDKLKSAAELRNAGKGLFVKEIEQALLKKKIDLAVHSGKDLPSEMTPDLALGAVPEREDASDLFIGRNVNNIELLPPGTQIGTSSLRRQAFLKALLPKLVPVELRGNLDTRLEKLRNAKLKLGGIIVAAAGVNRLLPGNTLPSQILPKDKFVPAAAQGALALQIRAKDEALREFLSPVHHPLTAVAVEAEREIQRRLEGGCNVPLGVYAEATDDGLVRLTACLASLDGRTMIRETTTGSAEDIPGLADALITVMKGRGASEILLTLPGRAPKPSGNGHKKSKARSRR